MSTPVDSPIALRGEIEALRGEIEALKATLRDVRSKAEKLASDLEAERVARAADARKATAWATECAWSRLDD